MSAIRDYLTEIQNEFGTGLAGEHAYRPALKKLLESADTGLNAVNDPARTEIGMPDFVVLRQPGNAPIGIVEAKDIGNLLSRTEKSQQLKRYMKHGNLLLTNYLEFRWYVNGEKRETARIAKATKGTITRLQKNYGALADMLRRFARQNTPTVNSAQELARRLADNAQLIAHFIEKDLKSSDPTGNLLNQMRAFQKTLLPGLDEEKFADMYAQTLAYGLFASRMNYPGDPARFSLRGAAEDIPRTNPFLRDLFYHSRFDLGSRLTWMVESLVEVLRRSDMDSILAHFGRRTQQTDPVLHFYETFLRAYNPALREQRGVYYTPEPVVKYIVRGIDHILKTRFDRPRGLADKDTLILDPAVGTGTFLYFVIEQIKARFAGQRGLWKSYVEEHLLPRIFGFELLMAPYTVAHMNLSLQLKDAGYEFKEGERLGIYLTNALEEGVQEKYESAFGGFIEEEAKAAAEIKRDKPIMVVLGNPPYSYASANKGEWISKLVRDYYFVDGKPLGERNPKGLQDDYVKFIRFAQWRIERTGEGILAFITNHGYLDNLTFRGMRQQLLKSFDNIFIINLHGNTTKREVTPDGSVDENIFDIRTGVAISIFVKESRDSIPASVKYFDIWGKRSEKQSMLDETDFDSVNWIPIRSSSPDYLFIPQDVQTREEYERGFSIKEYTIENDVGLVTSRDKLTVHNSIESIWNTVNDFSDMNSETAREKYQLGRDVQDWKVHLAQADIQNSGPKRNNLATIMYRPFDRRHTYFTGKSNGFMCRPRKSIMSHMHSNQNDRDNLSVVIGRAGQAADLNEWNIIFCTDGLLDYNIFRRGGGALFPIYLYPKPDQFDTGDDPSEYPLNDRGRRPNLSKAFVAEMEAKLGLRFVTEGSAFAPGDESPLPRSGTPGVGVFGPEDVFYYTYAIFHSPTYRQRYAEFLKIDFPRLPLTSDVALFAALVKYGAELVSLHLMKSPKLADYMTTYDIEGDNVLARGYPKYVENGGKVYINKGQFFGGVPQNIWDFHIGGYQVLHKWLKDRRGRALSTDDLEHYQQIVVALAETIRLMSAIDAAIPQFPLE